MSLFRTKAKAHVADCWCTQCRKAPKHAATPAEAHEIAMARIEEARRLARIEAQAKLDAEGLPRYAYDVAVDPAEVAL